jgi:protein tyrosine/serine phosphatase
MTLKKNVLRGLAGLFLIGLSAVGGYAADVVLNNNFNVVRPGELYRSAQPSGGDIALYASRYKIKTIVNLRGSNAGAHWYDSEVAISNALGITHIDFRMSSKRELTQPQAEALIRLLKDAPKPILIHCQSGADRSGLVSALYLAAIAKSSEIFAEQQMSIRYGHIASPLSPAYAMDRTFEKLEPWLGFKES